MMNSYAIHVPKHSLKITDMICYVMSCVMWDLFTVGSLQFLNDSTIASLEANQNRPNIKNYVNK